MKFLLLIVLAGAALLWLQRRLPQPRSAPSSRTGLGGAKLWLLLLFEALLLLAALALFRVTFSLFLRLVIVAVAVGLSLVLFGYFSRKKKECG